MNNFKIFLEAIYRPLFFLVNKMPFSDKTKLIAMAIVHIFETSKPFGEYDAYVVLDDGAGVSYGLSQFTHRSGSLFAVIKKYLELGGTYYFDDVLPILKLKTPSAIKRLANDRIFKNRLLKAAATPEMQQAQNEVAQTNYFQKAVRTCEGSNFTLPLSLAVIYDSINHGSFEKIRDRVILDRSKFGTDELFEKNWIAHYVQNRDAWLESVPRLKKTDYRTDFFLAQIARNNWTLKLPLNVHGYNLTEKQFRSEKQDSSDAKTGLANSISTHDISTESLAAPADAGEVLKPDNLEAQDNSSALPEPNEQNEQNADNTVGKTQETVSEKTETADGKKVEKTVTEEKSTFNPQNIPAFIPRFGKQWLLGLIPGGGLLATISAKLAAMPDWLVFTLGFFTGVTTVLFFQMAMKHREKVLEFITKCYEITANPLMNNLIPTNAAGFVGLRKFEIEKALAEKPKQPLSITEK